LPGVALGSALLLPLLFFPARPQEAQARPAPPSLALFQHVSWPSANPVWKFYWVPPTASSGMTNGRSGLEIRQVYYKGKEVFYQAHVPVLNVLYDQSCLAQSYRDWENQLARFNADNVIFNGTDVKDGKCGYAEPKNPVKTALDHPGLSYGQETQQCNFLGVAVEKRPDRLVMTTQMQAGWYRYIQVWSFLLNGTIQARYGFSYTQHQCTTYKHHHHAYWRFDFDIDGAGGDAVDVYDSAKKSWQQIKTETSRKRTAANAPKWRVRDKKTGRGYEVRPGANDGIATSFGVSDVWVLRYKGDETNDGGAFGGGGPSHDQIHINKFLTNENLDGQDIVMWYRAGITHGPGAHNMLAGPDLVPFGAGW